MTNLELVAQPDYALVNVCKGIDVGEVEVKVEALLDLFRKKIVPLIPEYEYWYRKPVGREGRQLVHHEVDKLLRDDLGVVTPVESGLVVGQPCLLVWNTHFAMTRDEYLPVAIQVGWKDGVFDTGNGGIWVVVKYFCEIPYENPYLERPSSFHQRDIFFKRQIDNRSQVVIPLKGI